MRRRLLGACWWLTAALGVAGLVLAVLARGDLSKGDFIGGLGSPVAGVYYAALGVLIVRRAGNRIGWLMLGAGALVAADSVVGVYGVIGIRHPGRLPAATLVGLFAEWAFVPLFTILIATFLLFPDGRLPSPRWWPAGLAFAVFTVLGMTGLLITPRLVLIPAPGGSLAFPNPLGVAGLGPVWSDLLLGTLTALSVASLPLLAIVVAALATRFRTGGPEVRQQVKWLAFAMAMFAVSMLLGPVRGAAPSKAGGDVLITAFDAMSAVIPLAVLPAIVTLAILKYRLYQIDVIISKTVKYALLSVALTAIYAAIVLGIGTLAGYAGGPLLTVIAAVAVAVLFQPARARAQLLANRLVYGRRATPYQVLADFAEDMAGQLDPTAALQRMAALLGGATGASRVRVWVLVGAELRPEVSWPAREQGVEESAALVLDDAVPSPGGSGAQRPVLTGNGAERTAEVRHSGELLGALTLVKPADEPVSAAEEHLLANVASQAGLVLRNARLTAELRATIDDLTASRRRLVRAQDEERQRIERNLHDGAQQQLVALGMLLRLVDDDAGDPAAVRQLSSQLKDGVHAAIEDLRALARGIYPPLLAEQGLPAALRAQAARSPLPVRIETDGDARYPREVEATVYFCVLEALQNAAKYARARQATVELACRDGRLEFSVTDDGSGFDTAAVTGPAGRTGTGLQGMADRLAAAGGTLGVRSALGAGTVISGRIPVQRQLPSSDAPSSGDSFAARVAGRAEPRVRSGM
jgi:signal transduction histidine kinase